MEHVQEGVTRDKIQSLMSNETWFDSKKMQQYFNVEIEEKAAVAACASDYLRNTTIFRRHSRELKKKTLSMRCLRNWRTGTMQQQRQRNRESRQKSRIFLQTSTCMEFKKERT